MIPLSLQNNFLCLWKRVSKRNAGWKIYQAGDVLCLRSSVECTKLQLCWGIQTKNDFEIATRFYEDKAFSFFENQKEPAFIDIPHTFKIPLIEMAVEKETFSASFSQGSALDIRPVTSWEELEKWVQICAETSGMKQEDVNGFMTQAWKHAGSVCLVAYKGSTPVGVADFFLDDQGVGLVSSVGVLEKYRSQGFGSEIMAHAIKYLFKNNAIVVSLYAYDVSGGFYEKIGFKKTNQWNFYFVDPK